MSKSDPMGAVHQRIDHFNSLGAKPNDVAPSGLEGPSAPAGGSSRGVEAHGYVDNPRPWRIDGEHVRDATGEDFLSFDPDSDNGFWEFIVAAVNSFETSRLNHAAADDVAPSGLEGPSAAAASRSRDVEERLREFQEMLTLYGPCTFNGRTISSADLLEAIGWHGYCRDLRKSEPEYSPAEHGVRSRLNHAAAAEPPSGEGVDKALERLQLISAEIDNPYLSEAVDALAWILARASPKPEGGQ